MLIIYRIICSPAEEHNKHTSSLGTNMEGMAGHGRITSVMHWECGWITVAFYAFRQQILRSFLKNNDSGSIQSQYFFMYMTISWYYIKEPRQQVLLAVVSCTDNCSKFQSLAMSKILYRSSVLSGHLFRSHPLWSLSSRASHLHLYIFTHQCCLQVSNHATSCLQSPYP